MLSFHLKKIVTAILAGAVLIPTTAKALSVGSLVMPLNLEDCSKRCVIPIVASGRGRVELVIARYLQRPTGERVYEEARTGDRLYSIFKITDGEFLKPVSLNDATSHKFEIVGSSAARSLRGVDTSLGIIVRELGSDKPASQGAGITMGIQTVTSMIVRLDMTGVRAQGALKISADGQEIVGGRLFQRFVLTNSSAMATSLDLSAAVKAAGGKRRAVATRPVVFQTMIPDLLKGKSGWQLSVAPGATVNLYTPVDDLVGQTIQIVGKVRGGRRLSSRPVTIDGPLKTSLPPAP